MSLAITNRSRMVSNTPSYGKATNVLTTGAVEGYESPNKGNSQGLCVCAVNKPINYLRK